MAAPKVTPKKRRPISMATLLKYTLAEIKEAGIADDQPVIEYVEMLKERVLAEAMK